jgi:hypothetical protein
MVDMDFVRQTARTGELLEHANDSDDAWQTGVGFNAQTLSGLFINDCQHAECAAVR